MVAQGALLADHEREMLLQLLERIVIVASAAGQEDAQQTRVPPQVCAIGQAAFRLTRVTGLDHNSHDEVRKQGAA